MLFLVAQALLKGTLTSTAWIPSKHCGTAEAAIYGAASQERAGLQSEVSESSRFAGLQAGLKSVARACIEAAAEECAVTAHRAALLA